MDVDDVEKRWHDPASMRAAGIYVVSVFAVAALAFVATVLWHSVLAAALVPITFFVGGLGALFKCYQVWRVQGTWPIWQAAGWILLFLTLMCMGVPFSVP